MARFALVTFLLKIGYTPDRIVQIFTGTADFDPEKTKYQVEHIAGLKGGRKRYESLSCASLRTLGLCREDHSCRGIRHPLAYLRRVKAKNERRKKPKP
jgi:DNA primase large subunit